MIIDYEKSRQLENELIQIMGLIKAVQKLMSDHSDLICVANALETRLDNFQKLFYECFDD